MHWLLSLALPLAADDDCLTQNRIMLIPVIAAVGDVDRDRATDFLVADAGDYGNGHAHPGHIGRAWVISGASGRILADLRGDEAGDGFGISACGIGDVDGDGSADWLVGAPGSSERPGRVIAFSGASGARLYEAGSGEPGVAFGTALCDIGDYDGDSVHDFAVGGQHRDGASVLTGRVTLCSGRDGKPIRSFACEAPDAWHRMRIAAVGDLDGDDRTEIVVRCDARDLEERRGVRLFSSLESRTIALPHPSDDRLASRQGAFVVRADRAQDRLGWRTDEGERELSCLDPWLLARAVPEWRVPIAAEGRYDPIFSRNVLVGDVDEDGSVDFAIGDPETGVAEGEVRVCSGGDGHLIRRVEAHAELWRFGASVVALGDVDSDLIGDFAVGCDHSCSWEPGEVRVVSGYSGRVVWRVRRDGGGLRVSQ